MRFCLFGHGEGVQSDCDQQLWATIWNKTVTDASISARKQGVRPGLREAAATALVPGITLCAKATQPTQVMQGVWNTLWAHTPWLETLQEDSFWVQLPGNLPSFTETRKILADLDQQLGEERRLRVGMAENPFLARALVAWSRVEKVQGALYRRVGRQQWIISPGLANRASPTFTSTARTQWIGQLPIQALWMLAPSTREALLRLGVTRLEGLLIAPQAELVRHFGKEALLWARFVEQVPGGQLRVNYPPLDNREVWCAPTGESIPLNALADVLTMLVQPLASALERDGIGALQVGFQWVTDRGQGMYTRLSRRPLVQQLALLAQLGPGIQRCEGTYLERVEVFATDLRPLTAVQTSFVIHKGMLMASRSIERDELRKVLQHVNHKYPRSLVLGARPRFRELRLEAISQESR